jgi:hypothetical protein
MSDESLRKVWCSTESADKEALMILTEALIDEDRRDREKGRWTQLVAVMTMTMLCPAALWFAAYGKTPLIRGAYALMAVGIAIAVVSERMYVTWSREALPGPADTRSQLQTIGLLLSRQTNLCKTGPMWAAPIFVGVAMVGLWIYRERSLTEGVALWALAGAAWLLVSVRSFTHGKKIEERRTRIERLLTELEQ